MQVLIVAQNLMDLVAMITLGSDDGFSAVADKTTKIFLRLLTNFCQIASPALPVICTPIYRTFFHSPHVGVSEHETRCSG